MKLSPLTSVFGLILNISPLSNDCCSQMISLQTGNGIVNIVISKDTYVVDCTRLRAGMRIHAFYDSNAPVPLIFPPQYRAEVVSVATSGEQVTITHFGRDLVASNGSLKLNLDNRTVIVTQNGQRYDCNPGGNTLMVFYRTTTRSIPPQTTPRKIIVFC